MSRRACSFWEKRVYFQIQFILFYQEAFLTPLSFIVIFMEFNMSVDKANLAYFQSGRALPWYKKDIPIFDFIGITQLTFLRVDDGHIEFRLPVSKNHLNVHNTVHGGVLATLADIGCLLAVRGNMKLERLRKIFTYTQSLRLDYLANVGEGDLIVCGKVISNLRTFSLVEVEIQDAKRNLLVRAL
jgi:uncharacterized protein (TIGR00369 family)